MAVVAAPQTALLDRTRIELRFSGHKLSSGEERTVFIHVQLQDRSCIGGNLKKLGWAEVEPKSSERLASTGSKGIQLDYKFEETQTLQMDIYKTKGEDGQRLASVTCTVSDILGSTNQEHSLLVGEHAEKKHSTLFVRAKDVSAGAAEYKVHLKFSARDLDKKDFLGKSDPFLEIYRAEDDGSQDHKLVYKTEFVKQTLTPKWKGFSVMKKELCDNDESRPLVFRVWDWNKSGKMSFIGEATTCLHELKSGDTFEWPLINEKKKKKKEKYTNSGILKLDKIVDQYLAPFYEYIATGLQLGLIVAIDYTGSNGDPKNTKSLHNQSLEGNPYTRALESVASVLVPYDSDGLIPMFGFGGLMPDRTTSDCFACNRNEDVPEVQGVQGLLDTYKDSFSWVKLDGPTHLAPVIAKAINIAKSQQARRDAKHYQILLIITDGEVNDMRATIMAIIDASYCPMSIIIVGVGGGDRDWSDMEKLDSDDALLSSLVNQRTASRDIVQFVHYDTFQDDPAALAAEVLSEIPSQVTTFYHNANVSATKIYDYSSSTES